MDDYTRKLVRVAVAQTCLNVGWSSIHTTPLEILTDLLCDYIRGLCKRTNNYAFLFNQNEPNLDHLGLAFQDLGISIPELEEYVNYFDNNNAPEVPQYPIPKESTLNFLKPGSREVVTRPVHVHEHLPPMYPHLEEQDSAAAPKLPGVPSPPPSEPSGAAASESAIIPSPGSSVKRRGGDSIPGESFAARRARALADEETRTLREISSVMMTTSGFLSHAREGKLPEVRGIVPEPEPEEPPSPPPPDPPVPEVKLEPQPPPPTETKPEKKKKKKSHDPSKKVEKENKNKEETTGQGGPAQGSGKSSNLHPLPDDSQVKKLATVKETSKLKVLKPGATKAIALTSDSTTSPKSEKKHKAKRPNSPAVAGLSPLGVPKTKIPKIDKQQVKERIIIDDSASDAFPDIKLTAEPDKQKLNIFKKITKVKEEHDEVKVEVDDHAPKVFKDEVLGEIFRKTATAASEVVKVEKDMDMAVDVVNLHSPTAFGSVMFGDDVMPSTPTTPRTPDIPKSLTDHKKKKREKHKEKKERERFALNSSPVSSRTGDDTILSKPKTPEVIVDSPDDHLPYPFLGYPTGPIIPPNLASNPLIPQAIPFGPRIPPPTALPLPPLQVKEVPPPVVSAPPPAPPRVPTPPPTVTPTETPVTPVKKKEKKDKKNKEKLKKKKDKKEKMKAKDKSEKKKLKLLKKQKIEEKKIKKDKKDRKKETQTQEEKRGDSPSVPKITFKLGPDPQREQSPNPKITFKPLVKKEEDVAESSKKHVETPQPSGKHHKGSSKSKSSGGGSDVSYQKLETPHFAKAAPPLAAPAPAVPKEEPEANQLWICPACGRPDDGSPMIACDACDMWYHYVCVGIQEAPESDWFCQGCINKKPDLADKKKKHKKKK